MHDLTLLRDLIILVAVAIPAVAVCERLKIPSVVGLLLAGILIGPSAFGLISRESVASLAELGVVLLLFEIGLEVSLSRIVKMGSTVFVGGTMQVLGTMAVATGLGVVGRVPLNQGVMFAALVALSSTAVVLKVYSDRGELDTPHGRVVLAILLFQDLAIVPLMLLVPFLAGSPEGSVLAALADVALSVGVVAALVGGGRLVVPWLLERVVGLSNRELFTLSIGFIGLATAYVTASVGLSLALGAFIAGLIISESEYGLQAMSDVLPFRALFSGIFFLSVGMLLDLSFAMQRPGLLLGMAAAVMVGKSIVASAVTFALGRSLFTSLLTGMGLAQVGEFSFVLATVAEPLGLLSETAYQVFLGASVLSMAASPFVIAAARPLAEQITRVMGRRAAEVEAHGAGTAAKLRDHAIIVGFGLSGQHLARVFRAAHLPYLVLEMNGQTLRRARRDRVPVVFGDGARRGVLHRAAIERARIVIYNIASPTDELRGVATARGMNPDVKILVRTRYVRAIPELKAVGADEVVVEEFEAALELFERTLHQYRIPSNTIERELEAVRSEHYGLLRGVPVPALHLDELKYLGIHHALELVEVEEGSAAVGQNPVSLHLRRSTGAVVVAVVRHGVSFHAPDPTFRFAPGDTVVLVGDAPALVRGAAVFRRAGGGPSGLTDGG